MSDRLGDIRERFVTQRATPSRGDVAWLIDEVERLASLVRSHEAVLRELSLSSPIAPARLPEVSP